MKFLSLHPHNSQSLRPHQSLFVSQWWLPGKLKTGQSTENKYQSGVLRHCLDRRPSNTPSPRLRSQWRGSGKTGRVRRMRVELKMCLQDGTGQLSWWTSSSCDCCTSSSQPGQRGRGATILNHNWGAMDKWQLLGEGESIFFKGVVSGRPAAVECAYKGIYGQLKFELMGYQNPRQNKTKPTKLGIREARAYWEDLGVNMIKIWNSQMTSENKF